MESVIENNLPVGKPKWLKVKLPIGQNTPNYVVWLTNTNLTPFALPEVVQTWANVGAKARQPS